MKPTESSFAGTARPKLTRTDDVEWLTTWKEVRKKREVSGTADVELPFKFKHWLPLIKAMFRPTVSVFNHGDEKQIVKELRLPQVFLAPIRNDIVQFVHDQLANNTRQAHGVNMKAGMKHSAESWGTGRAVARVPRVSGSGTNRTGQGAFANSCRKGRMSFPLQTWRRWHRKVNLRQRRNALASAIAATAVPSLILARGHRILKVPQFPLVLDDKAGQISKTKEAVALLKRFGAYEDVLRCIQAKKLRPGKGKMRSRRYKLRKGPLFVVGDESVSLSRALKNIPGVNSIHVNRLNIRHLAPGSQVGRFVIYTESAFKALSSQFGTFKAAGSGRKNFTLKREVIGNSDIAGIINSDAVQRVLKAKKVVRPIHYKQKKNPLRNKAEMKKLNPYAPIIGAKLGAAKKIKKDKKASNAHTKKSGDAIKAIEAKISKTQEAQNAEYKRLMQETKI